MSIELKIEKILANPKYSREIMVERLRHLFEEENQPSELVEAKIRCVAFGEIEDQFARTSKHKAFQYAKKKRDEAIDTVERLR